MFNQAFHLISFYNENKANPKISLSHHHKAPDDSRRCIFFEKEFLLAPVEHLNIFFHDNKFFFSLAARSDFISKIKYLKLPRKTLLFWFSYRFMRQWRCFAVTRDFRRHFSVQMLSETMKKKNREATSVGCKYLRYA